ncbi:hypothetical protein G5V59_21535 [Nocardioides sp. W3-2-3]|uniref:hypothetical protein n=1 Tax=Nocardioides convexus TaxID=2712224 RepID=UPI0024186559|nr:hypothetical protein [Nocardioides convexus]NHA01505.1 hypothetical protein [Nocardioides convexus]
MLTLALAWGAARTRVVPVEVSVVRGMVYVQQGESSYRFEVRKPETDVQMVGQPGDPGWQVRFGRRGLEPFVIDASMVDAHEFVAKAAGVPPLPVSLSAGQCAAGRRSRARPRGWCARRRRC